MDIYFQIWLTLYLQDDKRGNYKMLSSEEIKNIKNTLKSKIVGLEYVTEKLRFTK